MNGPDDEPDDDDEEDFNEAMCDLSDSITHAILAAYTPELRAEMVFGLLRSAVYICSLGFNAVNDDDIADIAGELVFPITEGINAAERKAIQKN